MKAFLWCLLLGLSPGYFTDGFGQPDLPRQYICYRTTGSVSIDGELHEADWKLAPFSIDFADIEGMHKPEPYHRTRVKIMWDDSYLYIGAYLQENHLWATYTQRESVIFHENDFEVFIDPDGDTHQYLELEINALGTIWDLKLPKPYRDGGSADSEWNFEGLKSAVALQGTLNNPDDLDSGWTIELAIPWDAMKEYAHQQKMPEPGETWRINFSRVQWDLLVRNGEYVKKKDPVTGKNLPERNWVWSPQGVVNMHRPETWGFIQFSAQTVKNQNTGFNEKNDYSHQQVLRELYYWQKENLKKHGKYLALEKNGAPFKSELADKVEIKINNESYQMTIVSPNRSWHIREDGKIWSTPL